MTLLQRIDLAKLGAWTSTRPSVRSARLKVPASAEVAPLIYWSSDWKTDFINRVLRNRSGVLIDVGANIGQTLVDYSESQTKGGYIGFEPNPRCVDIVTGIIAANALTDVALIPTGLSDASKIVAFYVRPDQAADTTATMVKEIRPEDPANVIYVPVFSFDDIYADIVGDRSIALIKIDVEGGELNVLNGMRRTLNKEKPLILCEVLHRDLYADPENHSTRCRNIMALIEDVDYKVFRLEKSPNNKFVTGLLPVLGFPEIIYGPENMHECDYLFSPVDAALDLLGG